MNYLQYENSRFYHSHAFNVATGYEGRSYQNHWHTYGEIIRVGEGDTNVYRVNQENYALEEGDFVLVWPMEQHEIIDADRMTAVVIQFSSAFANSLFDFERIMHYYHDLHVIRKKEHPELVEKLSAMTDEMKELYYSEGRNRESRGCILLLQLLILLDEYREELTRDRQGGGAAAVPRETVKKLISVSDFIKSNLATEDLSQAAMAERAGITQEHFSRAFKALTGVKYSKWLNMIRVDNAISLFPDASLSLTEIAMRSGFQSIPSFNRVFREFKGIAPGEYRNMNPT